MLGANLLEPAASGLHGAPEIRRLIGERLDFRFITPAEDVARTVPERVAETAHEAAWDPLETAGPHESDRSPPRSGLFAETMRRRSSCSRTDSQVHQQQSWIRLATLRDLTQQIEHQLQA